MRYVRKLFSVLIVLSVICSLMPMIVNAETEITYYGREALKAFDNSDELLYMYDQITDGIENSKTEISIYNGTDAVSEAELIMVYDAYMKDHAEHFWRDNGYSYSYNSETILSLKPTYLFSGDDLNSAKAQFETVVNEILSGIEPSMSDYEKELYLHNSLAERVAYTSSSNAHNAYGALVEGKAVCEGYSEAFQVLLHRAGINGYLVTGASINPATNSAEGHQWNAVEINDKFYYVDVTWDDQDSKLYHAYFNIPESVLTVDHALDILEYTMPACTSDDMFYFNVNGGKISELNVADVTDALDNTLNGTLYVEGGVDEFWAWLNEYISAVAGGKGVKGGFSYGYSSLGKEVKFYIKPSVEIIGASLDIGVDLTVKYYVELSYGYENSTMRFISQSGKVTEAEGVYDATGYYVYSYTGINPQCMSDNIDAELICDDLIIAKKYDYSVKEYCNNLVENGSADLNLTPQKYDKLKTLLADMLIYGAESQKYKNYNTDELADCYSWVNEYKSEFVLPEFVKSVTGNAGENKVKALGVHVSNNNKIYFKLILNDADLKITVNGTPVDKTTLIENSDGTFTYYSEKLYATQFKDVFEIILFDESNNVTSAVRYNVNAYINAKYNDATVGKLVKALSNYGESSLDYMDKSDDFNLDEDIL